MVARFSKNGVLFSFYLWENSAHDGYKNYITLACTADAWEHIYNIPVRDVPGYSVKICKKSCAAAGGSRGLFSFIRDCIQSDFMMDWVYKIIRNFEKGAEI